jgi:two-component system KDP operon response regulator KdpE
MGEVEQARYQALLIESDDAYRTAMAACMRLAGCQVRQLRDSDQALPALEGSTFDLVVWGVPTPRTDGHGETISELRLRTEAPLILVCDNVETARGDLEAGADQWLPKPFVPGALVGVVRAALRHSATAVPALTSHVEVRGMVLDGGARSLSVGALKADFTRLEWDLLSILVNHPNRFLNAHEVQRLGWRSGEYGPTQLRIYVRRLRQKLGPLKPPCRLLSQHGHGYCLSFE